MNLRHRMLRATSQLSPVTPTSGWDLTNAVYDSVEFGLTGPLVYISAIDVASDGSKLFVSGDTEVLEYNLSPAWNLATPSYVDSTAFGGSLVLIRGMFVRADGLKAYLMDNRVIRQYTLAVANDLSSFSDDGLSFNVQPITGDFSFPSFTLSADGNKLLLVNGGTVYQCTVSDPDDISSAFYDSVTFDISSQQTNAQAIRLKPDGTRFFVLGKTPAAAHQYDMSTPLAINTAVYNSVSYIDAGWGSSQEGLTFKADGTKMYVGTDDSELGDTIRQYSVE